MVENLNCNLRGCTEGGTYARFASDTPRRAEGFEKPYQREAGGVAGLQNADDTISWQCNHDLSLDLLSWFCLYWQLNLFELTLFVLLDLFDLSMVFSRLLSWCPGDQGVHFLPRWEPVVCGQFIELVAIVTARFLTGKARDSGRSLQFACFIRSGYKNKCFHCDKFPTIMLVSQARCF